MGLLLRERAGKSSLYLHVRSGRARWRFPGDLCPGPVMGIISAALCQLNIKWNYKLLVYYKSFKVSLDSPSPVESQAVSIEVLICFIVHGSPPATWIFYAPTSLRMEFCVIRASPSDCPLLFWFPYSVANLIGDRRNKFRPTAIHIANIHIQRIWKQVSLSFILSS